METGNDFALFGDERDRQQRNEAVKSISKDDMDEGSTGTLASEDTGMKHGDQSVNAERSMESNGEGPQNASPGDRDMASDATAHNESKASENEIGDGPPDGVSKDNDGESTATKGGSEIAVPQETDQATTATATTKAIADTPMEGDDGPDTDITAVDQEGLPVPHRMRTRAQAQAASDNNTISRNRSLTPESEAEIIHPYFLAPSWSRPDRDLGLPQQEAEDTRRLLQLYIQKQEEVCRGLKRLCEGLYRADRYRKLVLKWAKAEAHVGINRDMSDGEDWYDKEEWGLDADLKKGQDEEEEDAATTAKKTRTRRQ